MFDSAPGGRDAGDVTVSETTHLSTEVASQPALWAGVRDRLGTTGL